MKRFVVIFAAALGLAALDVTAAMAGEADDAPGLVLIDIVLIVEGAGVAVNAGQRTR